MTRRSIASCLVLLSGLVVQSFSPEVRAQGARPSAPPASPPAITPVPAAPSRAELPGPSGQKALSLVDALAKFRGQNLELAAQRFDVSATRADVLGAGLLSNPQVSAVGAFVVHGVPSGGQSELYLTVTQNAPIAGQLGLRRDAARGFASAAERDFSAAAWQLACDVRLAYLDLQLAQARYTVIAAASQDLDRVKQIIAERVGAGANPQYDRVRVSVEQSALLEKQTESEAALYAARTALAQTIGKDVAALGLVAEDLTEDPHDVPQDARALVADGLARRSEVAAARERITASDLRIESAKRAVVPSPDLSLGYSHFFAIPGAAGPVNGGALTAGLSVPLPLFDRGQGTIGRSQAEAEAQRIRAQQTSVTIGREVEAAHATALARVATFRRFRDTVAPEVPRMRQMAEVAYREGRATILELLDAYSTYLDARLRTVDLRGAALRAGLTLDRSVGPSAPPR